MLPWKLRKRQFLPVFHLSSVYFWLAKFPLVNCNLPLVMIWQMTHSQTAITVFSHLKVDVSGLLLGRSNHLSYKATTKSLHFGWSLTGGSTVFEINCNLLKPYSNYMITEM